MCSANSVALHLPSTLGARRKKHYIEPDQAVNPLTAEILEALAPP